MSTLPYLPGATEKAPALRVLVVDDNQDALTSLRILIGLWGHDARTATSGPEALRLAESFRPDVAVLDIAMPGLDGHETARRLRGTPGARGVLLVALSGFAGEENRALAQASGFHFYLVKPCDPEFLQALLAARAGKLAPGD